MGRHKRRRGIEVIARGVYIRDGQVLLCHTRGAWNTYLPGGHVEFGERGADALVREVEEELGVRSTVGRLLGVIEHTFDQDGEPHAEVNLVYQLRIPGLRPPHVPPACEDHIDFRWVPRSALRKHKLEPRALCRLLAAVQPRGGAAGQAG